MTDYRQGLNAEDWRSRNQSGFQQIASGLGKMAVIAGTTAVDSLVGTVAGIANVVSEAVQGNISKEHWFSDIVNAGVENPVSQYLIGINDKAEEWMPNYYTDEERSMPWYQQFWHANFIGDHFLKNTGFMVGAMLAGMATSGAVSSLTKLGTARNLFKDTAMAVGLGDKTAKQVLSAYKTGKAIGSVEKVSKALADAARNARNAELITKLVSSAAGSFGESRMEAITNSNDWFKKVKERLDKDRTEGLGQIEHDILRDRPDLFDIQARFDEQGNIIGYQPIVRDQREFNNEYNRRKERIENKYNQSLAEATRYRIDYSNASFGINFALTWGENFQLFGDALIGSYSKRSIFNRKVRQAQLNKYATDAARRTVWEANPAQYAKDIAKGIASPIFEGTQEMWQQGTTLALNRRAGSKINSYYGDVIDKDGLDVGTGYINNFMKALSDTYGDAEQWENFAMGFLTALLPIPSVTKTSSTETGAEDAAEGKGKPKSKITLGGELWESLREARKNREEANALADALNNLENDDRKRNMLMDIIRIDRSNQRQQQALDSGDEKAYKDEEALKLATMIMTYSDAGQMDYLRQLIDEIYTVETPEQVESIRKSTVYKKDNGGTEVEMSVFDGMSDDEIIDYFREQKKKMLGGVDKDGKKIVGVINRYDEIYKNINKVYGDFGMGDKADEYRKQLAFDIMQIDDREDRIKKISGELVDAVRKYADIFKAGIFTDEITPEQQKQLDEINQTIQTLTDISNLNIAIGNEGFLEKLNEIRNSQTDSIEDKAVKILELIEQNNKILDRKYQTGQTREAYNRFRKEHKAARQTDKEYQRTLRNLREKEDEIQQSIESTTQNLNISTKVDDLIRLLGDRESLYNNLAVLSGIGGVDFFFQGMSFDIAYQFDNYAKKYSKKFYDSFA